MQYEKKKSIYRACRALFLCISQVEIQALQPIFLRAYRVYTVFIVEAKRTD